MTARIVRDILVSLTAFVSVVFFQSASALEITLEGTMADAEGKTINGFNVSLIGPDGTELCKTMSKQEFDYGSMSGSENLPNILKMPKLVASGKVYAVCEVPSMEYVRESKAFIGEGTFHNISQGSVSVPFNGISAFSGTSVSIGPEGGSNFEIVFNKRKGKNEYYDFLREKPYVPDADDLGVENVATMPMFTAYFEVEGDFGGNTLAVEIDGIPYPYDASKGKNAFSFPKEGKFGRSSALVKFSVPSLNYETSAIVSEGGTAKLKLPPKERKVFAKIEMSEATKTHVFENAMKSGDFGAYGEFEDGRTVKWNFHLRGLQLGEDGKFHYDDVCEISQCPRYVTIAGKTFAIAEGTYYEMNSDGTGLTVPEKKKKTFFERMNLGYSIVFFIFVAFIAGYYAFVHVGVAKIKETVDAVRSRFVKTISGLRKK